MRTLRRPTGMLASAVLVACGACSAAPPTTPAAASGSSELRSIMTRELGPALSRLALHLFHEDDPHAERDPLREVERTAEAMRAAVARLRALEGTPHGDPVTTTYLRQLDDGARALADAAHARERMEAVHWFWHVESVCASCHASHRPASPPHGLATTATGGEEPS